MTGVTLRLSALVPPFAPSEAPPHVTTHAAAERRGGAPSPPPAAFSWRALRGCQGKVKALGGQSARGRSATPRPFRTDAGKKGVGPRERRRHQAWGGGESCFQCMVFPAKRVCLVPAMEGVRWAFSCGTWLPSRAEWLLAVRSIQPEEKERIGQFVFARDAKAAMVLQVFGIQSRGSKCWGRGPAWRPLSVPASTPALQPTCGRPGPGVSVVSTAESPSCALGLVSTVFVVASAASIAVEMSPSPVVVANRDPAKP